MKKFLALVLAAILVLSLSAVVFADDLIVDVGGGYIVNDPSNTQPSTDVERVEVPFTKIVDKNGGRDPGKETFEFEVFNFGNSAASPEGVTITGNKIETNGKGIYNGKLVLEGENLISNGGLLSEPFAIREKKGTANGWTYSDEIWLVEVSDNEDANGAPKLNFYKAKIVKTEDGSEYVEYLDERTPLDKMTFTNNYYMAGETSVIHIPVPVEKNPDTGAAVYTGAALFLAAALR